MKVEARSPSGARVELACAARSDVGRRRSVNEDSWGARFPLYFVADGMGGHKAGDVASQKVVSSLFGALPDERFITASELSAALARVAVDLYELGVGVGAPGSTLTASPSMSIVAFPARSCSISAILEPTCCRRDPSNR